MRKSKKGMLIVLTAAVLLILGAAFLHKAHNPQATVAVLSLNFQEGSSGLCPDGTPFDSGEILSDDVLEEAAETTGIPKETIAEHLAVKPSGQSAGNTIATDFILTWDERNGEEVLTAIFNAYNTYFTKRHTTSASFLAYEDWSAAGSEPIAMADHLENETNRIIKYVNFRIKENDSWTPKNGESSFRSLKVQAETIKDTDIRDLVSDFWKSRRKSLTRLIS